VEEFFRDGRDAGVEKFHIPQKELVFEYRQIHEIFARGTDFNSSLPAGKSTPSGGIFAFFFQAGSCFTKENLEKLREIP